MQQQLDYIFSFLLSHNWYLEEKEKMAQLLPYASEDVGDTIYCQEAINQPDALEFAKDIINMMNRFINNGEWELLPQSMVPEGVTPVHSLWVIQHIWYRCSG